MKPSPKNGRSAPSNRLLAAFLALPLIFALTGCFASPEEPAPDTNPLIYEILSPSGEVEGWMLGTIHALPDGVAWRTRPITEAISQADFLMLEIADLEDREAIGSVFAELGTTHGLPPIAQRVPPSDRPALRSLIDDAGLNASDFRAIETWAAALMLTRSSSLGDADNGVDLVLSRDFADRDILEFEGAVAQLTVFDRMAEDDQRVLLRSVLQDLETASEDAATLRSAWLTGDEASLEKFTTTGAMADKEVRDALLVNRNRAWVRQLTPLLRADDRPLVAVGAAHLVGEDGLPEMLKERGYTIRRLK